MNFIQKEFYRQAFMFAALLGDRGPWDGWKNAADPTGNQQASKEANSARSDNKSYSAATNVERMHLTELRLQNQRSLRENSIRKAKAAFRMPQKESGRLSTTREGTMRENLAQTANQQVRLEQYALASPHADGESESLKDGFKSLQNGNCKAISPFTRVEIPPDEQSTAFTTDWAQSARNLSRLYQRDARRYDGSYPLY